MAIEARSLKFYGTRDLPRLPQLQRFSALEREAMVVVSRVLPFRANNYVVEELIDWDRAPEDPIFQLTFPQRGMLPREHFERMLSVERSNASAAQKKLVADEIRRALNPHPAGQKTMNVPRLDDEPVDGVQRKYRETCLVFPSRGQTCHAYCTFCFRWPQFVGLDDLKFATGEAGRFAEFVRRERDLTDVLITGGDPMVMKTDMLARYLEVFLQPGFEHIRTIRIGTKSLGYWPYRYVDAPDADDLLRLMERVVASGRHLALMAHFNHWQEHETDVVREAVRRIRDTGAQIRTQSPLVRHINDDPDVWIRMWETQVNAGMVPYYMFVERDTGAARYFELPLADCHRIFQKAIQGVSGLARTARGPSMSSMPGKVVVDGVSEVNGQKVFVLSFMQARNPDWVKRPFFARFDPDATWLDDLVPAFGDREFFYERQLARMQETAGLAPGRGGGATRPLQVVG